VLNRPDLIELGDGCQVALQGVSCEEQLMNYRTSIVVRRHNRRVLEVVVGLGLVSLSSAVALFLGMAR
jgi:hypothetical protein